MSWLGMEYIHPHNYQEENYGLHHSWLYIMRGAAKIVFIGFGNVCFVAGLLLLFGALIFYKQFVLLSIFMLYVGFLFLYFQMYFRVHDAGRSREFDDTQVSADFISRPQLVVIPDNPPRYESLPDLQPELFKVTPPPYVEACSQTLDRRVVTVVPVHRSLPDS